MANLRVEASTNGEAYVVIATATLDELDQLKIIPVSNTKELGPEMLEQLNIRLKDFQDGSGTWTFQIGSTNYRVSSV